MRLTPQFAIGVIVAVGVLAVPESAQAQDLEGCDKIEDFVASGDFGQALVEVGWSERAISDLHYAKILDILGVAILGYEPGEGTVEAVMGFSTIEITHNQQPTCGPVDSNSAPDKSGDGNRNIETER